MEAQVVHDFGTYTLDAYAETSPCVQWTLDNEESLYLQAVTMSNLGYFHHSNWFVVPDDVYVGPDGYFDCDARDFTELGAAVAGTVLFAQSTQAFVEEQRTGDGAVIKVPPGHKVIGSLHMLNVGAAPVETQAFMAFDLLHPREVDVVLSPFRLTYFDLAIPPQSESRFTGRCGDVKEQYERASGTPMDLKLHYVLPHYHTLGNYFDLTIEGGSRDGESVFRLEGFNAEANGRTFDPPLDLSDMTGLNFTCGYRNNRNQSVGWGIGDQEMCVMLGLAEMDVLMDISVNRGTEPAESASPAIIEFEAGCAIVALEKNPAQAMPTDEERAGQLYVPPSGEVGLPPVPRCDDHDIAVSPPIEPTLTNVRDAVFRPSCTYSSCHGSNAAVAGLDLEAANLREELLNHEVRSGAGTALVTPGEPEASWLYRILAECDPIRADGSESPHMPLNSPTLLGNETIALVREWIAAGALDN